MGCEVAMASAHALEITTVIRAGQTPVLVVPAS
jgi:hypothetical protein